MDNFCFQEQNNLPTVLLETNYVDGGDIQSVASSLTEIHSKHAEISEKLRYCSRFCFSPKSLQYPPKCQ